MGTYTHGPDSVERKAVRTCARAARFADAAALPRKLAQSSSGRIARKNRDRIASFRRDIDVRIVVARDKRSRSVERFAVNATAPIPRLAHAAGSARELRKFSRRTVAGKDGNGIACKRSDIDATAVCAHCHVGCAA
jgi:hypothetical protein